MYLPMPSHDTIDDVQSNGGDRTWATSAAGVSEKQYVQRELEGCIAFVVL